MAGEPKAVEATLRTYVHATEDEDKVLRCLGTFFPFEFHSILTTDRAQGIFKNPIVILWAKVKGKSMREFIAHLRGSFSPSDRQQLCQEMVGRFSDGRLFLRFDKMAAFDGKVALGDGINLEITLTSYPYDEEAILTRLKEGWPLEVC